MNNSNEQRRFRVIDLITRDEIGVNLTYEEAEALRDEYNSYWADNLAADIQPYYGAAQEQQK